MGKIDELTTDDIKKWISGREKVINQVWSDDDLIEGLMTKERMMMRMIGTGEEKR